MERKPRAASARKSGRMTDMNFVKKMCILRQVKQGFSGDGRTLSGLVKIEQYGKNLSAEVSVINFAPLSSGEYYCLLADARGRTEMLPLRGKCLFNIVSELDASEGFVAVICFVKNAIVPIAFGVNGKCPYDWRTLVQSAVPPRSKETAAADAAQSAQTFAADSADDFAPAPEEKKPERAEPPRPAHETPPPPGYDEPPAQPVPPVQPPVPPTMPPAGEPTRGKYDDERVAAENYYEKEEDDERFEHAKARTYAYAESGDPQPPEKERQNSAADGDAEDVCHPFAEDPDGYYLAVKEEIDALFSRYPADDTLKDIFPASEWVRVRGEEGNPEYLVGVVYDDLKAKYICYALPAPDKSSPPEEIAGVCTFVPSSLFSDKEGFFVIFQSCSTGECIRPESS